ncbi:outer membrane lipoprotein-sorting protein [Haloferula helveola]
MKQWISTTLAVAVLAMPAFSQTAEQLMERARLAATLQQADLTGNISGPGGKTNVALFLKGKNIQFQFLENKKWVPFHLRLGGNQFDLFEFKDGKTLRFPNEKLRQPIAGSDLTYEDLSFRFLYWPKPSLLGDERVGPHNCYKIRVNNPGAGGAYSVVYVWVHKEFGAFMKIEGFDRNGTRLKRFEVDGVMKLSDGSYTLKEMTVATMNGDRAASRSKLRFDKPTRTAPGGGPR